MRILWSVLLCLGLCGFGSVLAQEINLDDSLETITGPLPIQYLQSLTITDDGSAARDDYSNIVIQWLGSAQTGPGWNTYTGTEYPVYDDSIWLRRGALRDGSIWPEDIEGPLPSMALTDGSCAVGVYGIDADGNRLCTGEALPSYWAAASSDTIYSETDPSSFVVDGIVVGASADIAPAARVAVDGRTDVVGGDLQISSSYNFRFNSTYDNYSVINRDTGTDPSQRTIIVGADATDRLGVGVTDPAATLHVGGGMLVQGDRSLRDTAGGADVALGYSGVDHTLRTTDPLWIGDTDVTMAATTWGDGGVGDILGLVDTASAAQENMSAQVTITESVPPQLGDLQFAIQGASADTTDLLYTWSVCGTSGSCTPPTAAGSHQSIGNVLGYSHPLLLTTPNTIYVSVAEVDGDDGGYCYLDVTAWGGIRIDDANCTMRVAGCAPASQGGFCGGQISLTVDANDETHVAFGISPGALGVNDFGGMVDLYPQLQTNGTTAVPSGLRLSNLSPTSPDYLTLEEVNCKLLTVDSTGQLQLVEYMPERCVGTGTTPPPPPPVGGECGLDAGQTFATAPTSDLCAVGSVSPSSGIPMVDNDGNYYRGCMGSGGGATASCTAYVPGACGSAAGTDPVLLPGVDLCAAGAVSDFYNPYPDTTITPNIFTWTCGAESTNPATCSVPGYPYDDLDGACGSAAGQTFTAPPTSDLCQNGIPTDVLDDGVSYTWDCVGAATTDSCTATQVMPISGECGLDAGGIFDQASDITNYCAVGTMMGFSVGNDGNYSWTCAGPDGGPSVFCTALRPLCPAPVLTSLTPGTPGTVVFTLDDPNDIVVDVEIWRSPDNQATWSTGQSTVVIPDPLPSSLTAPAAISDGDFIKAVSTCVDNTLSDDSNILHYVAVVGPGACVGPGWTSPGTVTYTMPNGTTFSGPASAGGVYSPIGELVAQCVSSFTPAPGSTRRDYLRSTAGSGSPYGPTISSVQASPGYAQYDWYCNRFMDYNVFSTLYTPGQANMWTRLTVGGGRASAVEITAHELYVAQRSTTTSGPQNDCADLTQYGQDYCENGTPPGACTWDPNG